MSKQTECVHKEILLGRYIFKDVESGVIFHVCKNCWNRMRHFKGYVLIESGSVRPLTRAEKTATVARLNKDVPF